MTSAEAPSLMPDAFPAVTEPFFWNAGRKTASISAVVSGLGVLVGFNSQLAAASRPLDPQDLRFEMPRPDGHSRSALAF